MALSLCIRKRAPVRSQVTRIHKEIISNLESESKNYSKATVGVRRIQDVQKVLLSSDKEIIDILAEDDEADLEKEMDDCAYYQEIIIEAIVAYEDAQKQVAREVVVQDSFMDTTEKIRLPTMELPKFSGNLIDWLTFWAQFEKIHLDIRLKDSDKFYYLLQSLSVDTEAYKIVSIYPLTEENYSKAIDALRRRYANPDLLLQVYVRELLKLVIESASGKKKISFHELYYKIQSYLGSLKSLNLESASPDTWLYPLVESCLSDELLLAWQRRSQFVKLDVEHQTRLDQLMDFLEREILIQQNIQLAKGGFQSAETSDQERRKGFYKKKNDIPTVTGLQQMELGGCVFCEKKHASQNCFAAKNMSLEEKRKVIRENKVCFKCLKGRHLARYCRTRTLMLNVIAPKGRKLVRAFFDSGSQHTYILKTTAEELGLKPVTKETVHHALFGGIQTTAVTHNLYDVQLKADDENFVCKVTVRDQSKICQALPRIPKTSLISKELEQRKIKVTDLGDDNPPIELLIGADIYGKLMTGKTLQLDCGLTAMLTHFGWTLLGSLKEWSDEENSMLVMSMKNEIEGVEKEDSETAVDNYVGVKEAESKDYKAKDSGPKGDGVKDSEAKPKGDGVKDSETAIKGYESVNNSEEKTKTNKVEDSEVADQVRYFETIEAKDKNEQIEINSRNIAKTSSDLQRNKRPLKPYKVYRAKSKRSKIINLCFHELLALVLLLLAVTALLIAMIKDEIDGRSWSLHLFTDASRTAYSAVVFHRVENEEIRVSFMSAKTRVTPMKREILKRNKKTGESEMIVKEISIDWKTLQESDCVRPIKWRFNPPFAAWWGGWWERLIRSMRNLLKRTPGKDGIVRVGKLKTGGGIVLRPIQRLCPMELDFPEEISNRFQDSRYKRIYKKCLALVEARNTASSPTTSEVSFASSSHHRTLKLPKIELKKFTREIKDWLGWWAQFNKIHVDPTLEDSHKFQYLVQSMSPGTRAKTLTERFGRPELLQQGYVRDLIRLMIDCSSKQQLKVTSFYDELVTHLRALESLKIEARQMSVFIFPMIEACLSEELMKAWQRSPLHDVKIDANDSTQTRVDLIMEFLQKEAAAEQDRALAGSKFGLGSLKQDRNVGRQSHPAKIPTASGLFAGRAQNCIFCNKDHKNTECLAARKMSIKERRERIKNAKCCFSCLQPGHISSNCRRRITECNRSDEDKEQVEDCDVSPTVENGVSFSGLSASSLILLQTLKIKVDGATSAKVVRALFDTGSQRSYILSKTAQDLGLSPIGQESLKHVVFGGHTSESVHQGYRVNLGHASGNFKMVAKLLDQQKICGNLPRLSRRPWLKELKARKIWVPDIGKDDMEIEILQGCDVLGSIFMMKSYVLSNGLTALQTRFGWTLMGECQPGSDVSLAHHVRTMTISESSITNLWNLDVLGIMDPIEVKQRDQKDALARRHFLKTVQHSVSGRYVVSLPWTVEKAKIADNREVAMKRLEQTTKKLISLNLYEDYDDIFRGWLDDGIIEKVPAEQHDAEAFYLPHRPVVKLSSGTTPIRPVFDASSKVYRSPSLNDCLEKGPNLIEMIPNLMLRFRNGKFGVVADIKKAFLQIEVNERDRDYLRFFCGIPKMEKRQKYSDIDVSFSVLTLQDLKLTATSIMENALMELSRWEHSLDVASYTYPFERAEISKLLAQIYDPIEFLNPILIKPKILLQKALIKRDDQWGTFVGNRVKEICRLSDPGDWRYVPSECNPANLPSRGCSLSQLIQSRWWECPSWLKLSEEFWPSRYKDLNEEEICAERKKIAVVTAKIHQQPPSSTKVKGELSVKEIDEAELALLKLVQAECFPSHSIPGLKVCEVEGILRVKTKLIYSSNEFGFQAVMNGRPMTYVSDDPNDLVTISPSMYLQEQTDVEFPECQNMGSNPNTQKLRYLSKLREELKSRFRKEYLSLLVQRNRCIYNPKLQAGDVVLVGMYNKKRNFWPLAVIEEILFGRDGVNRLVKVKIALSRWRCHLQFNRHCKNADFIPPSLRLRDPVHNPFSRIHIKKTQQQLLNARIKGCFSNIRHQKNLFSGKSHNQKQQSSNVINLSNRTLSPSEILLLEKGLKFRIPSKPNIPEAISSIESTIKQYSLQDKYSIRTMVTKILTKPYTPPPNYRADLRTLQRLKQCKSVVITRSDKGSNTVIMNQEDYRTKMHSLLNDDTTFSPISDEVSLSLVLEPPYFS
ncbi:hypothetical protein LAZ67_13001345 [Cordylochernes scorpioides]|uniref:CCHC-type domain-containing protein n=1 Tax=Cordylochernes scorpioides TaxID=51811 RepID=A0ABY6L3Q2_9ARAC|nr:hypothetical protein LAZ67_13001345 [Cordylochernes scorpioides]